MNKRINKSVKVILLKSIFGLGTEGSEIDVKPGYARYLLTEKKALAFNQTNKQFFLSLQEQNKEKKKKEKEEQLAIIEALRKDKDVDIYVTAGDSGKIFGRVTPAKIAHELEKKGHHLPDDAIIIQEDMKILGSYAIVVSFGAEDFTTKISVHVKDINSLEEQSKK